MKRKKALRKFAKKIRALDDLVLIEMYERAVAFARYQQELARAVQGALGPTATKH
jgi:hypothetical protein